MEKDALDELIVNEDQKPDSDLLAGILKNYVRFSQNGEILFAENFTDLQQWKKVLVYLLARKAAVIKKLVQLKECAAPLEISNKIFIPAGNISKFLNRELKSIVKEQKKCYFVPNYNLLKCKEILEEKS